MTGLWRTGTVATANYDNRLCLINLVSGIDKHQMGCHRALVTRRTEERFVSDRLNVDRVRSRFVMHDVFLG